MFSKHNSYISFFSSEPHFDIQITGCNVCIFLFKLALLLDLAVVPFPAKKHTCRLMTNIFDGFYSALKYACVTYCILLKKSFFFFRSVGLYTVHYVNFYAYPCFFSELLVCKTNYLLANVLTSV